MFLVVLSLLSAARASDEPPPPVDEACAINPGGPILPRPIYLPDPRDLPLVQVQNNGGETLCAYYGDAEDPYGGPVGGTPLGPVPPYATVNFPAPDVDGPTGFGCTGDCTINLIYP